MKPDEVPVDWATYNREFYSAKPASYFTSQWNLLMLAAAEPEALGDLLVAGVEYEEMIAKVEDREVREEDQREHLAFLITEFAVAAAPRQ